MYALVLEDLFSDAFPDNLDSKPGELGASCSFDIPIL